MKDWRSVVIVLLGCAGLASAEIPRPDDAPRPMSPEESKRHFQLPDGFRIDVVASEPLIRDPSCVAWDEWGRLFVTEIHGYNLEGHLDVTDLNKTGELDTSIRRVRVGEDLKEKAREGQLGSLKLLRDPDGDGRMDESIVWAEDIQAAYGVVPARGGVVVLAEPEIWFFADRDGDDRPDVRELLFEGFERGEMERAINNPVWGPDNWIYAGRGWGGATVTGPRLERPVKLGRTDFRFKPDGSAIEPVSGENHTFGMSFDDFGNRFLITTGEPVRYAAPLPYRYLARNPHVPSPAATVGATPYHDTFPTSEPHPWRRKRGADPRWVKFYGAGEAQPNGNFTSACGQQVYRAALFPEDYRGNHFACEPQQNLVHRSILEREGPGFVARRPGQLARSEFLSSSDGWFRPTNLRVGPDGALYIVDMYREIIEDYSAIPRYLQQQYGLLNGNDRGRIWRLAPLDSEPGPAGEVHQQVRSIRALSHPNAWWRETAQRLLVEDPSLGEAPGLEELVEDKESPFQARIHALHALAGRSQLDASLVPSLLEDPHWAVRVHGLQVMEPWIGKGEVLAHILELLESESDPSVLLQVALTLGESAAREAVQGLARLASEHGGIRWMESAILSSLGSTAGVFVEEVLGRDPRVSVSLIERAVETVIRSGDEQSVRSVLRAVAAHSDPTLQTRVLALAASEGLDPSPELQAAAERAMEVARDATRPESERLVALRLAPYASAPALRPTVAEVLAPLGDPGFHGRALGAMLHTADPEVAAAVIELLPTSSPRVAGAATEALLGHTVTTRLLLESGSVSVGSFSALQRHRLIHHEDGEVKRLAGTLFAAKPAIEDRSRNAAHYDALGKEADGHRGAALFATHCAGCHQFQGKGFAVGPSLDGESGRPGESLLADILDPGQTITAGYATYLAKTKGGGSFAGVLSFESATSVTLVGVGGVETTLLREELVSLEPIELSLMPSTFAEVLDPQDGADLVAYLTSPRSRDSLVLFDDDPGFPTSLAEGRGAAKLDWRDASSGRACLTVEGFQRFARHLPGWEIPIREKPGDGEFRYLRVSMKTRTAKGMMIELAAGGSFPPEDEAIRTYYAGENLTGWKSNRLAAAIPTEWQTFTIDLWEGNGDFELTGAAFTVMNGEGSYDRIELLRTRPEDRPR